MWSVDLVSPRSPPTLNGCTMAYLFSEQRTGVLKSFLVKEDNATTLDLALADIIKFCSMHDRKIVCLRFDAASVPNSAQFGKTVSSALWERQLPINQFDPSLRHRTKLDANNEFAISLGYQREPNGGILVIIPARSNSQMIPVVRFNFTPITEQIPEISDSERLRMELSADNDLFDFKVRVPDRPMDASFSATIRPVDPTERPSMQQQPFQAIESRPDLPLPTEPSLSDAHAARPPVHHRTSRSGHVSAIRHFVESNSIGDHVLQSSSSNVSSFRLDGKDFVVIDGDDELDPKLLDHF